MSSTLIGTVPHEEQAYSTTGDFGYDSDTMWIKVSQMSDPRFEDLVAVHEYVEATLCRRAGITSEAITAFDIEFERAREAILAPAGCMPMFMFRGKWYGADAEPGDCPDAPYARQHCIATAVERMMCAEMGIAWADYERANEALYEGDRTK